MRYEWGHHGSEPECPHVSVLKREDAKRGFDAYREGDVEDIFDLRLYGQADGTAEEQGWLAESHAALEAMVALANVGAKVMAAGGDVLTADQILDTDPHTEDDELVWVLVRR